MRAALIYCLVISICQLSMFYPSSGVAVFAQQQSPPKLQAGVNIDVSQPAKPLDPVLWTGNYFDKDVATVLLKGQSQSTNIWKKIPEWQAGDWESAQATNTRSLKYLNGRPAYDEQPAGVYTSKGTATIGWQRDKNGDIWHSFDSGYWTETDHDDYRAYSYIKITSPGSGDYPDMYSEAVVFDVDKATNKILDVQQRKAWSRFIYIAPGLVKEESVHTVYDERGWPERSAWNTTLEKRVSAFDKTEVYELFFFKDTQSRDSFVSFLKNNSLENLICSPEELLKKNPFYKQYMANMRYLESKGEKIPPWMEAQYAAEKKKLHENKASSENEKTDAWMDAALPDKKKKKTLPKDKPLVLQTPTKMSTAIRKTSNSHKLINSNRSLTSNPSKKTIADTTKVSGSVSNADATSNLQALKSALKKTSQ